MHGASRNYRYVWDVSDVSQSIREDSNYARTHGQRNGLLRLVIITLNLHKIDHVVMLALGNVHHVTHLVR